ncbi:LytTR family transcriptional regulator DNA-binding domain-containing protein [Pedobacter sp.]
MRIHRSYIASIQKISAYTAYDIEIGSLELPIGRQYMTAVKKTFSP